MKDKDVPMVRRTRKTVWIRCFAFWVTTTDAVCTVPGHGRFSVMVSWGGGSFEMNKMVPLYLTSVT